jgi:hypothetical protein
MKMETSEIKKLLQKYFNGESNSGEEKALKEYFTSDDVAEELLEYAGFFNGISELSENIDDSGIEEEIMDFILENEHTEKTRYRWLWQTVTGIAASIIIVLGGFLFYQQQQKPFRDTFEDPEEAYAYAQQTLEFVSGKYNKGLADLSNFEKINKAAKPIKKGVAPVNNFYNSIEKMEKQSKLESGKITGNEIKSNDSI